jgi:hypothetical protein
MESWTPSLSGIIGVAPAPRKVRLVRDGSLLIAVASKEEDPLTQAQTTKAIREGREERDRRGPDLIP